ncbi:MAG: class I SAM-dependent methyltransferase [Pseudomonadales bacterium]
MQALIDCLAKALHESDGSARRAFHGRGQCFSGLEDICVDLFEPVIVVSLFAERDDEFLLALATRITETVSQSANAQRFPNVLFHHRSRKPCVIEAVRGSVPSSLNASENGKNFELNMSGNQNLGFFLDARPARDWLLGHCEGAKVLNLFAYTCAFSVAAVAGGAARVVNNDMSRNALRVGERNHRANFSEQELADNRVKFMPYEMFRSVSRLAKNGPFDIIIVDPPSFQPGSFVAKSDYAKLVRKLPRLLRRGGKVLTMLNAPNLPPEFLQETYTANFPELKFIQSLDNSTDFPDADTERSLKMMVYECQRLLAVSSTD